MKPIYFILLIICFSLIVRVKSKKENGDKTIYINKCCPEGEYVYINETYCVKSINLGYKNVDFSDVPLFYRNKTKSQKTFKNVYNLRYDNVMATERFKEKSWEYSSEGHNHYLSEEGLLFEEDPNQYNWWTEHTSDNFCIDYTFNPNTSEVLGPRFWSIFNITVNESSNNRFYAIGLFVSSFFLALTFLVKFLLPRYWNLSEMIQMSYVASTFVGFFVLAVNMSGISYSTPQCIGMTYIIYFFIMASFSWMVVMSYDLWRLLGSNNNSSRSVRRKVLRRYSWLSAGAWGVPTVLTIFLIVTNHIDLRHIPWFIQPNIPKWGCFIHGGHQLLYMYIPMSILILINWILFFRTSYNIWLEYKKTSSVDANNSSTKNNHRTFKKRFCVYLKLSIITGISWILEMASSFNPKEEIWYVTDCYNMLTGLSIFLILVCNKKTYNELRKKFKHEEITSSRSDTLVVDHITKG